MRRDAFERGCDRLLEPPDDQRACQSCREPVDRWLLDAGLCPDCQPSSGVCGDCGERADEGPRCADCGAEDEA
jgi:hypothetical protein